MTLGILIKMHLKNRAMTSLSFLRVISKPRFKETNKTKRLHIYLSHMKLVIIQLL